MPAFLDLLSQHLGGEMPRRIGEQIGADPTLTERAIAAALPLLMGGLARNANASRRGAEALAGALERDHDGSLLDRLREAFGDAGTGGGLGAVLGGHTAAPRTLDGDGIVGHVLGERRHAVELGISRASGMNVQQVNRLLAVLAPIMLNALGRLKREGGLSADNLAALLNKERATLERTVPDRSRTGLLDFLDADGDGEVADEVEKIGASLGAGALLGRLFGKPA